MKAAARFVLVPAVVLWAALTAVSDGACAAEGPVMPFPGAAADDGGRTTQAAPTPLGTTAASPVTPATRAVIGNETASAAEGAAQAETATGPAPIAMPAGKGAPQDRDRKTEADGPAGGSRLLRMLARMPHAPASSDDGAAGASGAASLSGTSVSGPRVSGPRVFTAEGCPRALLRRLLAGAAGEADALSALGIEREILTLCRERQEILVGLFEAEAALRELSAPPPAPEPVARTSEPVAPAPPTQTVVSNRAAAPSPLRATLAAAERADETDPEAGEPQVPRYAWFSIVGTAGALRAGVTDGTGVWFVREGDPLPGGARIAAIAGRPPGVRVTISGTALVPGTLGSENGEAVALPYRAWPGDVP